MRNDKEYMISKKKKTTLGILCGMLMLCMAAGCDSSADTTVEAEESEAVVQSTEAAKQDTGKSEQDYMTAEEFHDTYMSTGEVDVIVSQPGNYIINGVELCDAVEASEDMDDSWEGYTEQDLGLLPPSKMPNVQLNEQGYHGVFYNNEYYIYANDLNRDNAKLSGVSQYANVWCAITGADRKILGGWEEYGRACAGKGIIIE